MDARRPSQRFDRRGKKILLREAPQILQNLNQLKSQLQTRNKKAEPLKIGTFEVFSTYFLSFLNFLKWDDQAIELHELLPGEIEKYLADGQIDLGISYMPIAHPNIDFLKVVSLEMGVFTQKDAFKNVEQPEIPFVIPIMPLQGVPTKIRGLDGWPESAYDRKVHYKVTLMESALELCRQGRVAGYFPKFIVDEHNKRVQDKFRLVRRRFPGAKVNCYSDVFILKRKSTREDKRIKQMARALRRLS